MRVIRSRTMRVIRPRTMRVIRPRTMPIFSLVLVLGEDLSGGRHCKCCWSSWLSG